MEYKERLVGNPRQTCFQARIQGVQTLIESRQIRLIPGSVGRVFLTQVSRHFGRDHTGVGRGQPQVRIQRSRTVIVVVFGRIFGMGVAIFGEMTKLKLRQGVDRHRWQSAGFDHPRHETFHVRANPVQKISRLHAPYVGRTQGIVMRRSIGRQKHLGMAHAVLHSSRNQLQGFDAGQHADLGPGRANYGQTGG